MNFSNSHMRLIDGFRHYQLFDSDTDLLTNNVFEFSGSQLLFNYELLGKSLSGGYEFDVLTKYPSSVPFDDLDTFATQLVSMPRLMKFLETVACPYKDEDSCEIITDVFDEDSRVNTFLSLLAEGTDLGNVGADVTKTLANILFMTGTPENAEALREIKQSVCNVLMNLLLAYGWKFNPALDNCNSRVANRKGVTQIVAVNQYLKLGDEEAPLEGDVYFEIRGTGKGRFKPKFSIGYFVGNSLSHAKCSQNHSLCLVSSELTQLGAVNCSKCKKSTNIDKSSYFYFCSDCSENVYYCRSCGAEDCEPVACSDNGQINLFDLPKSYGVFFDGETSSLQVFSNGAILETRPSPVEIDNEIMVGIYLDQMADRNFELEIQFIGGAALRIPMPDFNSSTETLRPAISINSPEFEVFWNFGQPSHEIFRVTQEVSYFTSVARFDEGHQDLDWLVFDSVTHVWRPAHFQYDAVTLRYEDISDRLDATYYNSRRNIARGLFGYFSTLTDVDEKYFDAIKTLCEEGAYLDDVTETWAANTALIVFKYKQFAESVDYPVIDAIMNSASNGKIPFSSIMKGLYRAHHLMGFQMVASSFSSLKNFPGRRGVCIQSAQPYVECDETFELFVSGSDGLEIIFDEKSSTNAPEDFIQFYTKDPRVEQAPEDFAVGEKITGTNSTFPGEENPMYLAGTDKVWMRFQSKSNNSSNSNWKVAALFVDESRKIELEEMMAVLNPFAAAESRLLRGEQVQIFESKHDYDSNTNVTFPVEFESAEAIAIAFSSMSSTELNYDFIKFLKQEGGSEVYGEEKYSGGRSGSLKKFPGVGACPVLVIPTNKFWVNFFSDGRNNSDSDNLVFISGANNMFSFFLL